MSAYEITVLGLVQGIGYIGFVADYAEKNGLVGSIKNSGGVVRIYVECDEEEIGKLTYHLRYNCPKGGRVDKIEVKPVDHVVYDEETTEIKKGLEEAARRVAEVERAIEVVEAERLGESVGERSNKSIVKSVVGSAKSEKDMDESAEKEQEKEADSAADETDADDSSDEIEVAEGVVLDEFGRELDDNFRVIEGDDYEKYEEDIRFLPADIAPCKECEKELLDPTNRRYRYPFISCSQCGPRYSIMKAVPYSRDNSTMESFVLCQDCAREYSEPGNRRRFSQTIGCKNCGPKLRYYENRMVDEVALSQDEILDKTVESLKAGKVGAVKGVGGFHFMFIPTMSEPAQKLRDFKDNINNPFSVLFPNVEMVREYCELSEKEEEVLTSPSRPMVILDKKEKTDEFVPEVLCGSDRIGVMLPSDPVQIILSNEVGPIAITSGNKGGELIITDDMDMIKYLPRVEGSSINTGEVSAVAFADDNINKDETTYTGKPDEDDECFLDFMLTSTREITSHLDDSLVQVVKLHKGSHVRELVQIIRRARGYIPEPIVIENEISKETFGAGGDARSVFGFGKKTAVYMSEHFGSLFDNEAVEARSGAVDRLQGLLNVSPKSFVGDLSPTYFTSKDADERAKKVYIDGIPQRLIRRQHHASHILSVAAEHGLKGRLLGVSYDGMGYGSDGTIWGSEIFSCVLNESVDEEEAENTNILLVEKKPKIIRSGALLPVKLIGGEQNSRDIKATLCGYFKAIEERQLVSHEVMDKIFRILNIDKADYGILSACLRADINTFYCASMGRLFDAVTALLGVKSKNTYDGESPIALEGAAYRHLKKLSSFTYDQSNSDLRLSIIEPRNDGEIYRMDQTQLVADILIRIVDVYESHPDEDELRAAVDKLAYEFHNAVISSTVYICDMVCSRDYIQHIALSGGSLYNRILVDGITSSLELLGYRVFLNEKVPAGDGGLSLGQIYGDTL